MERINWNDGIIDDAKEMFVKNKSIRATAEYICRTYGCECTGDAVRNAFKRNGFDYRSVTKIDVVKSKRLVDPANLSDDQATERIAQLIAEAAKELKLDPQDVTWVDFKNFAGYHWGADVNDLIEPRHITRVGGYANIRDAFFPPKSTKFSVEKQELSEKAKIHRSISLIDTVNTAFLRQLQEVAASAFSGKIIPSKYALNAKKGEIDREVNALISDLHYGALLSTREVRIKYGPTEEARRTAAIAVQIAEWKPQYRSNTKLRLLFLGDWIQNHLHDMRDGAPLAEQACAAIHYGSSLVSFVSQHYPQVDVYCVTGNHGRNTARHSSRATVQKWDSIESIIYYAIKAAACYLSNVTFHIPHTPYFTWESFGAQGYGTHGDTEIDVGFPGKNIPTGQIEGQVNKLNATLPDANEYKVVTVGHVHTASITNLANGSTLITNGALLPSDQYAGSICIPETNCGQMIFESAPGHIVGDTRFCRVNRHIDVDASLDVVVTPFTDF